MSPMAVANHFAGADAGDSAVRSRILKCCAATAGVIGLVAAAAGAAGLLGWALDIPAAKGFQADWATMKANTALAFAATGLAMWLRSPLDASRGRTLAGQALAALAAAIGLLNLAEYAFGWNLGIDQLLFVDEASIAAAIPNPGRLSPMTAINSSLIGTALVLLRARGAWPQRVVEVSAILVLLSSYMAVLGYVYDVGALYQNFLYSTVALNTAFAFLALGIGLLAACPDCALMQLITSRHAGGLLARRMLPIAVVAPIALGWLRLEGQRLGYYGTEFGVALIVAAYTLIFAAIILWNVRSLDAADRERQQLDLVRKLNVELEQRAAFSRAVIETASDAFIAIDENGTVTEWNPQAEGTFGWTAGEALGRLLADLIIPPPLRKEHHRGLQRFLATGEAAIFNRTIELTALRRDGTEIPVELSVWPQRADGKWVFNAFIRNIAERRRAETAISDLNQQLEQRVNELHAANKDLESFSYSIAHDLRSPLTGIQGFAELILEDHGNEISGEAKDLLQRVIAKTAQMTRLIHELLEFTRLGRRTLRMEPVDLASLVRQTLAELERDCEGRAIRFSVSALGEARGDPALLRQVFANLLGNAVKFTRHRDPATIEVGCRRGFDINGAKTYFVKDNGAGFDPKYAEKIFGVFERLHGGDEFEGTGIGLAIVQRIIERHGGRIWADARPDSGATFYFTLPAEEAPPDRPQAH